MLQPARDFRDECDALFTLLSSLDEEGWNRHTQFKGWTPNDIVAHLHFGDYAGPRYKVTMSSTISHIGWRRHVGKEWDTWPLPMSG